jgi:ATP-dependent RNA helicase DeaD
LGYTPRSLLDLIEKEAKVPANQIDDMRIMEDFSFVSVSHADAEKIIDAFAEKVIDGKKSIVNRAKDDNRGGSGRRYG